MSSTRLYTYVTELFTLCAGLINGNQLIKTDRPPLGIKSRLFCFVYPDWLQMLDFHMTLITCISCKYPPCACSPNKRRMVLIHSVLKHILLIKRGSMGANFPLQIAFQVNYIKFLSGCLGFLKVNSLFRNNTLLKMSTFIVYTKPSFSDEGSDGPQLNCTIYSVSHSESGMLYL